MLPKTSILNKALFIARYSSGLNSQSNYKKLLQRMLSYKYHFSTYRRSCEAPKLAAPECCIDSGKYYDQLVYLKEPRLNGYFCKSCPIGHEPVKGLYECHRCKKSKQKKQVDHGKCAPINQNR